MPLVRRQLSARQPTSQLYEKTPNGPNILNGVAMSNMLGLLHQLAELSEYATEVFDGLLTNVISTGERCSAISARVEAMDEQLPEFEAAMLQVPPRAIYSNSQGSQFKRADQAPMSLLEAKTAPEPLMARRLQAAAPPQLHVMDELKLSAPAAATSTEPAQPLECLKGYSHPGFFFEQWLLMEEERQRKEAELRRQNKSKKGKKKKDKKVVVERKQVELVKFKRYNADGAEFTSADAEAERAKKASVAAASFDMIDAEPMTIAMHAPQRARHSSVSGNRYEQMQQAALNQPTPTTAPPPARFTAPAVQQAPPPMAAPAAQGPPMPAPPTVQSFAQPPMGPPIGAPSSGPPVGLPSATGPPVPLMGPPVGIQGPPVPPVGPPMMGPPIGGPPTGPPMMGPPVAAAGGPPLGPPIGPPIGAGGPPIGPPVGAGGPPIGPPVGMAAGPPLGAMSGPPIAAMAGPPVGAMSGPPLGVGGPPIAPPMPPAGGDVRNALLGAIQAGAQLRKMDPAAAAPPPPPDMRSSLLSQIKSGAQLRKADERPVAAAAAPQPVDARSSMLSQIKAGAQLRKVTVEPAPKKVETNASKSVLEIMARRAAIAAESDSESDGDDDWD